MTVLVLVVALLDQSLRWRYFLHTWFDGLSETLVMLALGFSLRVLETFLVLSGPVLSRWVLGLA